MISGVGFGVAGNKEHNPPDYKSGSNGAEAYENESEVHFGFALLLFILFIGGGEGGLFHSWGSGRGRGFSFVFVLVVLGTTDAKKGAGNFAGLAIGLSLILVHIVCIPITGTSVNPARSIAPALFQVGEALSQLWIFIVAPFIGAALAAGVWKTVENSK